VAMASRSSRAADRAFRIVAMGTSEPENTHNRIPMNFSNVRVSGIIRRACHNNGSSEREHPRIHRSASAVSRNIGERMVTNCVLRHRYLLLEQPSGLDQVSFSTILPKRGKGKR